jgi:hypothetical protein
VKIKFTKQIVGVRPMFLAFKTTRDVMRAEKLLRAVCLPCKIVPIPKRISSECGMGIDIDNQYVDKVNELLFEFEKKIYYEKDYK